MSGYCTGDGILPPHHGRSVSGCQWVGLVTTGPDLSGLLSVEQGALPTGQSAGMRALPTGQSAGMRALPTGQSAGMRHCHGNHSCSNY